MSHRIIRIAALGLLLGLGTQVAAESFDREQAVRHALAHNPELLAMREQVAAAGGRTQAAQGARLPSLGLSYSARSSNNPLDAFADKLNTRSVTTPDFDPARLNHPGTSELHTTQLALRLPLYAGGRLSATLASAEEMENYTRLQYERARELTAFQTLRAWQNVQATQEGLSIADDALRAAQEHARTTAQLSREGRIVVSDRLTAEVHLAAVQSQREQAATRLESSRNQLKFVMGLPLDKDIALAPAATYNSLSPAQAGERAGVRGKQPAYGSPHPGYSRRGADESSAPARREKGPPDLSLFPPRLPEGEGSLSRALDVTNPAEIETRALANRQDLAAARAMQQAAKVRVRAARAVYKPSVDFIATHNRFDDNPGFDEHSSSIMGVVSLDLYAGGRHQGEIVTALAEEREAQWRVLSLEQTVRHDVREARENLRAARARHASAADNAERAKENVRLVKQRYGQGRTLLIDLLQAERSYTDARSEELVSRVSLEVGQAALQLAEGALPLPPEETQ